MGGGLMQLVAYGAQDIYLTGNPQITFFKVVYRRHTNFSMETIQQTLNGAATSASTSTCTISRNGDLVYRMYVTSEKQTVTNGAETLVSEAELEIGGQKIDKHYSEWMNVWNELSTPESKAVALKAMQGSIGTSNGTSGVGFIQVPLQFWFCRNPGLALPLIALQYHEVKVKVTWGTDADNTCGINCDYIYLDTDERRRFAQVSHEYLIEQLQKEDKSSSQTHKLNFNHPVKELIWTTDGASGDYTKANLKLNGHDRFALQDTEYFQLRQPYECHTAVPRQNLPSDAVAFGSGYSEFKVLANSPGLLTGPYNGLQATPFTTAASATYLYRRVGNQTIANAGVPAAGDTAAVQNNTGATPFVAVWGGAGTGSAIAGQLSEFPKAGDVHLITVSPADGANIVTTTVKVKALYTKVANQIDGDAALPPTNLVSGGGAFSSLADDNLHEETVIIQYDKVVAKAGAVADNDTLTIVKVSTGAGRTSQMTKKINVYSFALKPEEHQPSGTCNFSRIDNAQLIFSTAKACTVYAVNYNVLRIMSGMGGLAYSN